jgi:colicin import membrane protein
VREKIERDKARVLQAQADKAQLLKAEQLAKAEQARAAAQKARQSQQSADKQRDDNLKRLNDLMTNAGGSPQGSTSRASAGGKGSSTTYSAIARAAVIPNVVFTETFDGNPLAKVEVRLQSDGTIISSRVVQPSGNDNWDKAVLNAVIRTRVMPKDVDGKLPDTILILEFKPRF